VWEARRAPDCPASAELFCGGLLLHRANRRRSETPPMLNGSAAWRTDVRREQAPKSDPTNVKWTSRLACRSAPGFHTDIHRRAR
jgi:hypothetical protein